MPLKMKIRDEGNTTILVWDIAEHPIFFSQELILDNEIKSLVDTYSKKKKLEWLSTRYLLKLIIPNFRIADLSKDDFGKPYLLNSNQYLSISHSHKLASIIISEKVVGIDVQKIHNNIEKISHKFINDSEYKFIDTEHKLTHMHIIWGAKESMYKGYGKKELRFKEHMSVHPYSLESGTTSFTGNVHKGEVSENYILKTRAINDYILVYAIQK